MLLNWLKRTLGIKEIESKVIQLETEKTDLENRVINSEQRTKLICKGIKEDRLSASVKDYFANINIQISEQGSESALIAVKAIELIDKYKFQRYVAPVDCAINSSVISLKELQENPERYFPKLSKGFLNFPLGLNFDKINEVFFDGVENIRINHRSFDSNKGTLEFVTNSLLGHNQGGSYTTGKLLLEITNQTQLNRIKCSDWISIDTLDFLFNYDSFERFFIERPNLSIESKKRAISKLRLIKFTYLAAMEIVGTTRIKDITELLNYENNKNFESEKEVLIQENKIGQNWKLGIKEILLTNLKGTSYLEIQGLLPIASKEKFVELASKRTHEILASDKLYKRMTDNINKPLKDYTVSESILLACYFTRNIIQHYETLDDAAKNVINGKKQRKISGKCTDFTALSLHYLREYLVPLNSGKFKNWHFGFDSDVIGDYKHCYMKGMSRMGC